MPSWYSDVPISAPAPHGARPMVSMAGFVFTNNGIGHEVSPEDFAEGFVPKAPAIDPSNTVFEDAALDSDLNTEYL